MLIAVVVLGVAFVLGMFSFMLTGSGGNSTAFSLLRGKKVGVVRVEGAIISADGVIEDIEKVRKDKSIASVVIRIESPGGSVGASQEILEAIRFLAKDKPVIASMGNVAASGGYYVALGAEQILANPGTITGSIGVRMEHVNVGGLLKWAKIGHETLKSGEYKDIGSMDRPLSSQEKAFLEGLLQQMHEQFKADVAAARGLERKDVDRIADGRVYSGQEAIALGLVDKIGGFAEAIKLAAELGGISGEPKLVYPEKRRMWFMRFLEEAGMAFGKLAQGSADYWRPVMSISAQALPSG
jgi:protease-4